MSRTHPPPPSREEQAELYACAAGYLTQGARHLQRLSRALRVDCSAVVMAAYRDALSQLELAWALLEDEDLTAA